VAAELGMARQVTLDHSALLAELGDGADDESTDDSDEES
jgi:hypothetical protein